MNAFPNITSPAENTTMYLYGVGIAGVVKGYTRGAAHHVEFGVRPSWRVDVYVPELAMIVRSCEIEERSFDAQAAADHRDWYRANRWSLG